MEVVTLFNELMKNVEIYLKSYEFQRKEQTFYLQDQGNLGLINFQRGQKSTKEKILFTINLGIASKVLLDFFPPPRLRGGVGKKKPLEYECHWRKRVGEFLPGNQEIWWTIDGNANIAQISQEILRYLDHLLIPELKKYISDKSLRDLWFSGMSPGITDFDRLKNLAVLVRFLGPHDFLASIIQEIRLKAGVSRISIAEAFIQTILQKEL